MNINLDDPKLTAYALDELSGAEKTEIERAIAGSPAAQEFVRELRLLSGNLRAEYDAERESHPAPQTNILPLPQEDSPWSMSRRLALDATIALCAALGAVAIGTVKHGGFGCREETRPAGVDESLAFMRAWLLLERGAYVAARLAAVPSQRDER